MERKWGDFSNVQRIYIYLILLHQWWHRIWLFHFINKKWYKTQNSSFLCVIYFSLKNFTFLNKLLPCRTLRIWGISPSSAEFKKRNMITINSGFYLKLTSGCRYHLRRGCLRQAGSVINYLCFYVAYWHHVMRDPPLLKDGIWISPLINDICSFLKFIISWSVW